MTPPPRSSRLHRLAQCARKGLETRPQACGCGSRPASTVEVHAVRARVHFVIASKDVAHHRPREVAADEVVLEARGLARVHEFRAAADIGRQPARAPLSKGHSGVAERAMPGLVAERLAERRCRAPIPLSSYRVAARRCPVSPCAETFEVDEGVLGEGGEHVGRRRAPSSRSRSDRCRRGRPQLNTGFARLAPQFGDARRGLGAAHRFILAAGRGTRSSPRACPPRRAGWPGMADITNEDVVARAGTGRWPAGLPPPRTARSSRRSRRADSRRPRARRPAGRAGCESPRRSRA